MNISMQTVADAAGVSKMTVSLALRGDARITSQTREKVLEAAERCGYHLDPVISETMHRFRTGKGRQTGVTIGIPLQGNKRDLIEISPFLKRKTAALETELDALGFLVDWIEIAGLTTARIKNLLKARSTRGVYLPMPADEQLLEALEDTQLPVVSTAHLQQGSITTIVSADYAWAVRRALRETRQNGKTRPGYTNRQSIEDRVRREALGQFLAWAPESCLPEGIFFFEHHEERETQERFKEWVERYQPDVIISMEFGLIYLLENIGLSDLPFYCLNCQSQAAGRLGGIAQSPEAIGISAARQLSALILHRNYGLTSNRQIIRVRGEPVNGASFPRCSGNRLQQ